MLTLVRSPSFFVGLETKSDGSNYVLFYACDSMSTEFRTNKPSDVISALVSIYDSKGFFVKELQVLLTQRLLSITKDNLDRVEREV